MTNYLMLSAGVIFVSVLVSFIIPEGKLNKSINFVVRIACVFILLSPLLKIFDFKSTDATGELVDYDFLCEVYAESQNAELEKLILENVGAECECSVNLTYEDGVFKENGVNIVTAFVEDETIGEIQSYLHELGYININVNEKSD